MCNTILHWDCIVLKCRRGHNSGPNGQKQNLTCTIMHCGLQSCYVLTVAHIFVEICMTQDYMLNALS